jgi:hypothetical protein
MSSSKRFTLTLEVESQLKWAMPLAPARFIGSRSDFFRSSRRAVEF